MDYVGTDGNDIIDQQTLGIPDWSTIRAGKGNDRITIGNANALGEEGNDTIIGTTADSSAVYWTSTTGIKANLATGVVTDGLGGTDTLINIRTIQGSSFDDVIIGSSADETFWGLGGSNTITGGGGNDTAKFYNVKSTDAQITYDKATDTFTVRKNFADDKGTDTYTGISHLVFVGPQSDNVTISREDFTPGAFVLSKYFSMMSSTVAVAASQLNTLLTPTVLDANHDGINDMLLYGAYFPSNGTTPVAQPAILMLGKADGSFTPSTTLITPALNTVEPREIVQADFNEDGLPDYFIANHGYDATPFPGEKNALLLSVKSGGFINASANLPSISDFTHSTTVGDINGDGHQDIFVGNMNNGGAPTTPYFLLGDGKGNFTQSTAGLPSGAGELLDRRVSHNLTFTSSLLADLNGDGKPELILGSDSGLNAGQVNNSFVFWNTGAGYSPSQMTALPNGYFGEHELVHDVLAMDIDGDGDQDLLMLSSDGLPASAVANGWAIQVLRNDKGTLVEDTLAHFAAADSHEGVPGTDSHVGAGLFLKAMDVNGDGAPDLIMTSISNQSPSATTPLVWMNDGFGHFQVLLHAADFAFGVDAVPGPQGINFVAMNNKDGVVYINAAMARQTLPLPTTIKASDGNDTIKLNANNNIVDGGNGFDTAVESGKLAQYTITNNNGTVTIQDKVGTDGTDTLSHVERVRFSDSMLGLDIAGVAGQAYRIYQAAFDRAPDAVGLGYWIAQMDRGASLTQVAQGFIDSPEFRTLYGSAPSHADVIGKFYQNVLHRTPDKAGFDYWVSVFDAQPSAIATILASFSESPENQAALVGVTANGIAYQQFNLG